jgi:serine/threonine protein kinase
MSKSGDNPLIMETNEPIFTSAMTTIYERTTITEVMHLDRLLAPASGVQQGDIPKSTAISTAVQKVEPPEIPLTGLSPIKSELHADLIIEDSLGIGGMGTVYLAQQQSMNREVAIKRSHHASGEGPSYGSVQAEGLLFGKLDHPNIPPVHMVGQDTNGHAVLVMKRIDGTDLHTMLKDPEHPRWADVEGEQLSWMLNVFISVSHAVDHAHSRHVLHRDIKCENIMVCDFGQIFLIDWGIAVDLLDEKSATTNGKFIGTPCFAAPEMATNGLTLGPRTDVYLLGAMLLEMLSGSVLYRGSTLKEIVRKVRNNEREPIPKTVPRKLAEIIAKATSHEVDDRYSSVKELLSAVHKYKSDRHLYASLGRAEQKMINLEEWLKEQRTDPQTAYRFMTDAHEALALLKSVLKGGVAVDYVRKMLAKNVTLQTRYAILTKQFGVATTLLAELSNEMGDASPWVTKLAGEIAEAKEIAKARASEIQIQTNVRMIEKLKKMEEDLLQSGQTRDTIRATLTSVLTDD